MTYMYIAFVIIFLAQLMFYEHSLLQCLAWSWVWTPWIAVLMYLTHPEHASSMPYYHISHIIAVVIVALPISVFMTVAAGAVIGLVRWVLVDCEIVSACLDHPVIAVWVICMVKLLLQGTYWLFFH